MFFKKIIKSGFNLIGYGIHKRQGWMENYNWLKSHNIKTIIDIGANEGQYALFINQIFPYAKIHSFEPIRSAYKILVKNTKAINIETYNMALGEKTESRFMNVNEFTPSSSILELSEKHKSNFNFALETTKEEIKIRRLDDVLIAKNLKQNILIKLDVQGYEHLTIEGGQNMVSACKVAIIEVSYSELYKGQTLFNDIYEQMKSLDFEFKGNFAQVNENNNGAPLYADAIFINKNIE